MIWLAWALGAAAGALLALVIFWIMWASISALGRAQAEGRLTPLAIRIGTAWYWICAVWDVVCNWTICCLIFGELPQEPTLSQRLRRLVFTSGWRQKRAVWVAVTFVNPLSPDPNSPHIPLPTPAA